MLSSTAPQARILPLASGGDLLAWFAVTFDRCRRRAASCNCNGWVLYNRIAPSRLTVVQAFSTTLRKCSSYCPGRRPPCAVVFQLLA